MIASGLASPTAFQLAPDGRIFVCEQTGKLRVIKNGTLLPSPFVTLTVNSSGERGLLGVAFDPAFATTGYVYVYYTATLPAIHNRLSRFTASGDVAAAGSERILLELDNLTSATNHNGGAIHFGVDGKLYVAVGDNATGSNAQSFSTVKGKILRLNGDGSTPEDNPFYKTTTGNNRAIWALGLRNPFTFSVQPLSGRMFINDVGQGSWEEINDGIAAANYGWPTTEGSTTDPRFESPLHAYGHGGGAPTGCAITGGAFYNPTTGQFPAADVGDYFFADYCSGWIRKLETSDNSVSGFASGIAAAVDLKVGDEGSLYYLARGSGGNTGVLHRIRYGVAAPSITAHPVNRTVAEGQSASFNVSASGTPPLTYQWQRNGSDIAGATSASYTLTSAPSADNGARFRAVVTNDLGNATSNEATLTVTANQPPAGQISQPAAGSFYTAGTRLDYSGTASDPEDGTLPASAFTWQVDFHHDTHTHPVVLPATGSKSGSFDIPSEGETSDNVWYRIHLTVADSRGRTHATFRDVLPRKVTVTLATTPAGLQITLDGQPSTSPLTFTGVVGVTRTIGVSSPQSSSGSSWQFQSWSDGGAASHPIATPSSDATYTATFSKVGGTGTIIKINFQPAPAPVPSGYLVDSGAPFGARGNGASYGWTAANPEYARDRNSSKSPDQRYDTLLHMQKPARSDYRWEIAVPNGSYQVRIVAGDAQDTRSTFRIAAEGVLTVSGKPSTANRWLEGVATVAVNDGRLTISNGTGAANNKVCFVEITPQ